MSAATIERYLADDAATRRLGQDLALAVRAGDMILLQGDLGAGKSTLARALIRTLADDADLDVPSPTFTLVQSYATRPPVHHFDLYRLAEPAELAELGLADALADGVALVEWPEQAGGHLASTALTVSLAEQGSGRLATITGEGPLAQRAARSLAMRDFLERAGWGAAARQSFVGDASARAYELVTMPGEDPRVLMNSPPLVMGPPVRDGRTYAEIAHTSRTVDAFVAVDRAMKAAGLSVPEIFAQDLDRGLLLLEHLGTGSFLEQGRPDAARYAAAAELLAFMHGRHWEPVQPVTPGVVHVVPAFDCDAMMIEVDLLVDWYVPAVTGAPASEALMDGFHREWNALFDRLAGRETTLMMRDYHSPNIIWRPERSGLDRLGLLDFQDALIGPPAYDLASLAMDARVTVPADIERSTIDAYLGARGKAAAFDEAEFLETYAIMAAQRNSKILGIFVRLDRRDGKPAYLNHLPRIRDYLRRALAHPALAGLRTFYEAHGILEERIL